MKIINSTEIKYLKITILCVALNLKPYIKFQHAMKIRTMSVDFFKEKMDFSQNQFATFTGKTKLLVLHKDCLEIMF